MVIYSSAFTKLTALLYFTHFQSLCLAQSTISFCDGQDQLLTNEADCHAGIIFGERKPDCVCISGIYRSWTEECGLYDGFTSQYCSSLWNDNCHVQGIRLLSGLGNIYKDTVAVFGENASDFKSWTTYSMNSNEKTWSDTFYTLNGFPFMLTKANDKFICVEPAGRKEKQVCRYFAIDNLDFWEPSKPVRILIQKNCEIPGYDITKLREQRCYDILNKTLSECQLDNCANGKVVYVPGSLQTRAKKSVNVSDVENGEDGNGEAETLGTGTGLDDTQIKAVKSNANFFMHRKLNKYIRLRQSGQLGKPVLSSISPNRTFLLLQIGKGIVRDFCPQDFISDMFLDQAFELFIVLHRGQDFRYIEDIPFTSFKLIQEILLRCKANVKKKGRVGAYKEWESEDKRVTECRKDDFLGEFWFIFEDTKRQIKLKRGEHHKQGKYHFVIDAIWQIVNMLQARCMVEFRDKSLRMLHLWEQASENLLTRDIRELWFNPQVDIGIYNELLSNRALVDMVNLERCTEAAYSISSMPELVRPEIKKSYYKRRKRDLSRHKRVSVAKSVDVYCAKQSNDIANSC